MQRYFSTQKENDNLILSSDDWYHIQTVMRMKVYDQIEVVYENFLYICEIIDVDKAPRIKIKEKKENTNSEREVTLIVPLLKEQKMDFILQKATELGVSKIIPFYAERSIIKIDKNKEEHKLSRWNRICKEASEQSKRLNIPIVTKIHTLTEITQIDGLSIVCSTTEKKQTIKKLLQSNKNYDKLNIIMGPEGGLSEVEESFLEENGFQKVTLGSRIMRAETVPLFLMSIVHYEYME